MDVMKIEEIVGDIILLILDNYEPLKKIGIENDKFFVRVKGYDEYGLWIYQPKFTVPKITSNKKNKSAVTQVNFSRVNNKGEVYLTADANYILIKEGEDWYISGVIIDSDIPLGIETN